MNVHQTMEDVMQPLQHVQIQLEVSHVLVFLDTLEMVLLVLVTIIFFKNEIENK